MRRPFSHLVYSIRPKRICILLAMNFNAHTLYEVTFYFCCRYFINYCNDNPFKLQVDFNVHDGVGIPFIPVKFVLKFFVPVSRKNRFGTPNVPDIFKPKKNMKVLTIGTKISTFHMVGETHLQEQNSPQPVTKGTE